MDDETRGHVLEAMQSEALAYARMILFAAQAREEGDWSLAATLEGTARDAFDEHFTRLAELAGVVGADADNLSSAIGDKSLRAAETYRCFAEQARVAGETAVADCFEAIRAQKLDQVHVLEATLERLEVPR